MEPRRRIGFAGFAVFAIAFVLTGAQVSEPWRRRADGGRQCRPRRQALRDAAVRFLPRHQPSVAGGAICPNLGNIATEAARIVRRPDYHGPAKDAAGQTLTPAQLEDLVAFLFTRQ